MILPLKGFDFICLASAASAFFLVTFFVSPTIKIRPVDTVSLSEIANASNLCVYICRYWRGADVARAIRRPAVNCKSTVKTQLDLWKWLPSLPRRAPVSANLGNLR